jgi:hypothetical protein
MSNETAGISVHRASLATALATGVMTLSPAPVVAQEHMGDMPMGDMPMSGMSSTGVLGPYPMSRDSSGTSWQPDDSMHAAIHGMAGDWMLMGHLMLWGIYDRQSGPRGADKAFAEGMLLGAARRDLSNGDTVNLRAMLSPDPFMGNSGYPELLASGETANGVTPLLDRQHPHDLFMELAASYAHRLNADSSIFLYAADPGEPALGPAAFMHRASGMDIPDAPITHHWLDSTHITFGVLTAGVVHDGWKLEVSQFTGREPDQNRYDFDPIKLDSTAARLSWNPDPHWSLQVSWGHLNSPEQLAPGIDENRTTASATYVTKLGGGTFATTLAWGLKQESGGANLNGVLLEGEYRLDPWTAFARTEWEQNDELDALGRTRSVGDLTVGAIHDWPVAEHLKVGLGALYAFDFTASAIAPAYGDNPHGFMGLVRLATR